MTYMEMACAVVVTVVVPFAVQAIKTEAMRGSVARWVAIGASVAAGLVTGFVTGIPDTPAAWLTCVTATIGGVQLAYAAFRSVGITSKWLDALLALGSSAE